MAETYNVVCPECDRVNRLPRGRTASDANCGACGTKLFQGKPLELDAERFQRHVSRSDLPVVADFWAEWCGPCRMMAPAFEQVARELEPKARFVKVNVDRDPSLASSFGISGIPALLVFKAGQVAARQAGAQSPAALRRWVEQSCGLAAA